MSTFRQIKTSRENRKQRVMSKSTNDRIRLIEMFRKLNVRVRLGVCVRVCGRLSFKYRRKCGINVKWFVRENIKMSCFIFVMRLQVALLSVEMHLGVECIECAYLFIRIIKIPNAEYLFSNFSLFFLSLLFMWPIITVHWTNPGSNTASSFIICYFLQC